MIVDWILVGLLGWQIMMPAVDNAKYTFAVEKDGTIIRMNTQNGSFERCNKDFVCEIKEKEKNELDKSN